jgi:hypothetical protein
MPTVAELIEKYKTYDDKDLYEVYYNIANYSKEAQTAIDIVLKEKGGFETILSRLEEKATFEKETLRVKNEINKLLSKGFGATLKSTDIPSPLLSEKEITTMIGEQLQEAIEDTEDKKIKPRTLWGSILGGFISGTLGGIVWGMQLIGSHRIFWLLAIGEFLFCTAVISGLTRQSKKNVIVLVASILATAYAIGLGFLIWSISLQQSAP